MAKKTILPFGPQHPVLPEPIQLQLVMEDEIVVEAIPAIGYVHRGLEKLTETKAIAENIFVVERICGICSFMHALCYCQGIESLMNITVPDRSRFLRVIWGELHRLHSHHLWLGLLADAFGFESLFMQCWRNREMVMDIMEMTAGSRVIISTNALGGVRRDIDSDQQKFILNSLNKLQEELDNIKRVFSDDYTVNKRLVDVAVISKEDAHELGAVGPVMRASGLSFDYRTTGYAAYNELDFEPIVEQSGDCYARMMVRLRECYQSIDIIRQAFAKLPEGPIASPVKGFPSGEIATRVEQPRGEVLYYIKANGTNHLDRLRVRTPTFANIPALLKMVKGLTLADIPIAILSIDPCISCTER